MKIYYSPSNNAFFNSDWHGPEALPSDCLEIDASIHQEMMDGQASGKLIVPGGYGLPTLQDPPAPSDEVLSAEATIKKNQLLAQAALKIAPLQDANDLGIATEEELVSLISWKEYRVALSRIPTQPEYPRLINWPQMPEGA